ncbi:MAG: hypothetical protein IPO09_14975 [Anaeromyxobacter sp.]|nr:hypothetical protein [Anaeromyxobacter sp.]MBL0277104.1 hypothetical protein [Anaeromyxobacter sp.]
MRSLRLLPVFLALLALAGCGGGGGSDPAPPATYSISGAVTGSVTTGVTVTLSGAASATTTTGAGGAYTFNGLAAGSYTVTPSLAGHTFSPASLAVTLGNANATGKGFVAAAAIPTITISGTIGGATAAGVTVWLVGEVGDTSVPLSRSTTTDASGHYSFEVPATDPAQDSSNMYAVRPTKAGYAFEPALRWFVGGSSAIVGKDSTARVSAITAIAAGNSHSLVIKSDGSLWGFGANNVGNLGVAAAVNTTVPVSLGAGYATAAGGIGHTVALKQDGSLWTWGWNDNGQLGQGFTGGQALPTRVGTSLYVKAVASQYGGQALRPKMDLYGWGSNVVGQVGDFTTTDRNAPVYVHWFVDVEAGQAHSVAQLTTGGYETWGFNANGQLGNGTLLNQLTPAGGLAANYPVDAYKTFALGLAHTLALGNDGVLWGWGNNFYGQLGDGTQTERYERVQIMTDVVAVATHDSHSLAIKADGSLWAWGKNAEGQVGNGSQVDQRTPVQIGTGFAQIACGSDHSLAVKSDGTVWAWGLNNFGQLGDGLATARRLVPGQVTGL